MYLNSVLFPAPKSSYTLDSLSGKLIWIPKHKKNPNLLSHSSTSFAGGRNRANSTLSYDTPMLQYKRHITVANLSQKLKNKEIDPEEYLSQASKTEKRISKRQQSSPNCLVFTNTLMPDGENNDYPRLTLNLIEHEEYKTPSENKREDTCGTLGDETEKSFLSTTMLYLNTQLPRNTLEAITKKRRMHKIQERDSNNSEDCNLSQTSFDPKLIDEYGASKQNLPTNMVRYPTRTFSNPILDARLLTATVESKILKIQPTLTKKLLTSTGSFQSSYLEPDFSQTTSSSTKLRAVRYDSFQEPFETPKQKNKSKFHSEVSSDIERHIPCLLLVPAAKSDKVLVYFHGNSEDVNLALDLLTYLRNNLIINVLAIEYPGYGLYEGSPDEQTIIEDTEAVYEYLIKKLNINPKNILLYGRSIGTGPASYLASRKEVGALILMSAFTSIRAVVKDLAGTWAQYMIKERFNNLEAIAKVRCPTFFIHGQQDKLIPYTHSADLHNVCGGTSELLLPKEMDHLDFDLYEDFTFPLMRFLQRCGVINEEKCTTRIHFPKTLFDPPSSFLRAYRQRKAESKKKERKRSHDPKVSQDSSLSLNSKFSRMSLIE